MTKLSKLALVALIATVGFASAASAHHRVIRHSGAHAFAMVPAAAPSGTAFDPALTGGGSGGYNASIGRDS